jgi:hypothetical protein
MALVQTQTQETVGHVVGDFVLNLTGVAGLQEADRALFLDEAARLGLGTEYNNWRKWPESVCLTVAKQASAPAQETVQAGLRLLASLVAASHGALQYAFFPSPTRSGLFDELYFGSLAGFAGAS